MKITTVYIHRKKYLYILWYNVNYQKLSIDLSVKDIRAKSFIGVIFKYWQDLLKNTIDFTIKHLTNKIKQI